MLIDARKDIESKARLVFADVCAYIVFRISKISSFMVVG